MGQTSNTELIRTIKFGQVIWRLREIEDAEQV